MNPPLQSWAKHLSLQDGESRRINHEGCRAGQDSKRRLWVYRSAGRVFWKCHHCGDKNPLGGIATGQNNRTQVLKRLRPTPSGDPDKMQLPYDFDSNFNHWPPEARAWVLKYGIEKPQTWGWSESQGRVVIPVYQDDSGGQALKGYQTRRVLAEDTGPKYLTRGAGLVYHARTPVAVSPAHPQALSGEVHELRACVVEDALSGEKVGQVCDAYAMLGTSRFSHSDALQFASRYARLIVWYDDNNWNARKASTQLAARLALLVPTRVVRTGKDPKEHSLTEIKEIVR